MAADTLDRLLTSMEVRLHASSVCAMRRGQSLAFGPFEATTLHFVLHGAGRVRIGDAPALRFGPRGIIIVPARQPHVVGTDGAEAPPIQADAHRAMLADGLVMFQTGKGAVETLLLCGQIPSPHGAALGLFDLLHEPLVEADGAPPGLLRHSFDLMRAELASPGFGTQAITEALMKQCLVAVLRQHLSHEGAGPPPRAAPAHPGLAHPGLARPGLARALLAILEQPAAPHSVESLAAVAGMSRASFAEHFARAFGQAPIDFVQKARLRIAARLLATTDLPVKVIAQSIGYAAPTGFSRAFRATYGADPSTYRLAGHAGS